MSIRETDAKALKGREKTARIPVKIVPREKVLRKPPWLRVSSPLNPAVSDLKNVLHAHGLHTVCEEASCPNIGECFGHGTATFMIMGKLCTRRCPFCDVAHGRPDPLDPDEPRRLADVIADMGLRFVVVTSVDRDDLRDGGGGHFRECIRAIRSRTPKIHIEVLVPDFRGRVDGALDALSQAPPDVFNHNLETVPSLYRKVRPGGRYPVSLGVLQHAKETARRTNRTLLTKAGVMLGLGEPRDELLKVMGDLRAVECDILTLGQYLRPTQDHLPVVRYVPPAEFAELAEIGRAMGFRHVESGPLVRSSYHAWQHVN